MRKEIISTGIQVIWVAVCMLVGYNVLHINSKPEVENVIFLVVTFAGIFAIGQLARRTKR